jgi:hypothetical protein
MRAILRSKQFRIASEAQFLKPSVSLQRHFENRFGEQNNVADKNPDVVKKFETLFKTARTESKDWQVTLKRKK